MSLIRFMFFLFVFCRELKKSDFCGLNFVSISLFICNIKNHFLGPSREGEEVF